MFDWRRFFEQHGIEFVTRGPNVGRDQINIKCPFCGEGDPSHHMGVSLAGQGWGCWRSQEHRGKSRARLIQALLHCSMTEAHRLAGTDKPLPPRTEDLQGIISRNLGLGPKRQEPLYLDLPREFHPMAKLPRDPLSEPFWDYLEDRGYESYVAEHLVTEYELHWTIRGDFKYRIIFPIFDAEHRLKTWTGRAIQADPLVRYKTLPAVPRPDRGADQVVALQPPSELLLGLPLLWRAVNPRTLVVCEGPFDALRITGLGWRQGVYGTCLFGLTLTNAQVGLLAELATRFPKLVLLLDNDAALKALSILTGLTGLPCQLGRMPEGVKDPGDLPMRQGAGLIAEFSAT